MLGSGAALLQGWVTDGSHNTTIRMWKQGQAMKEKLRNMTSVYRHVFRKATDHQPAAAGGCRQHEEQNEELHSLCLQ